MCNCYHYFVNIADLFNKKKFVCNCFCCKKGTSKAKGKLFFQWFDFQYIFLIQPNEFVLRQKKSKGLAFDF